MADLAITGFVDCSHAAFAQQGEDLVTLAQDRARGKLRNGSNMPGGSRIRPGPRSHGDLGNRGAFFADGSGASAAGKRSPACPATDRAVGVLVMARWTLHRRA